MAFDGRVDNIGEAAVLNANGGAVAFFGTTRTVYADRNAVINQAFLRYVLSMQNGKPITIGEAQRQAKNYLITSGSDLSDNKLQYTLLGDPAICLNIPQASVVIDSINGQYVAGNASAVNLASGTVARVTGHTADLNGQELTNYNGTISMQVLDSREPHHLPHEPQRTDVWRIKHTVPVLQPHEECLCRNGQHPQRKVRHEVRRSR